MFVCECARACMCVCVCVCVWCVCVCVCVCVFGEGWGVFVSGGLGGSGLCFILFCFVGDVGGGGG